MSRHDFSDKQWAVIEPLMPTKQNKRGRPRVDSAQPHDITLAEPTLQTISVPRRHGCPTTRPNEVVAGEAYNRADVRRRLCRRGIPPTIPPLSGARTRSQSADVRSNSEQATANAGMSSGGLAGWTSAVAGWCAMIVICISIVIVRFVSSPLFFGALTEF